MPADANDDDDEGGGAPQVLLEVVHGATNAPTAQPPSCRPKRRRAVATTRGRWRRILHVLHVLHVVLQCMRWNGVQWSVVSGMVSGQCRGGGVAEVAIQSIE